jgi:prophage tail gpP-like protein
MPKPQETAILIVNGQEFGDWESVWVQQRWADSFTYFRFTAAERDPIFTKQGSFPLWTKLQFKPGDTCTVVLAGQVAVTGFIETRQVAYDANQHGVMLIGKSWTAPAARSSVNTKTGNFDKKNILQVAQEVLAPYPVGIKVVGSLDLTPFDKLQNEKGELIWDFLERIARPRGVVMGSDELGNILLIGDHAGDIVGQLIEGVNIKSCQATVTIEHTYEEYRVDAQTAASDDNSGTAASELTATVGTAIGTPLASLLLTAAEQPVKTQPEVAARARNESIWHDYTQMQATIVTQGWLKDGVQLWHAGDDVFVRSPMALLNNTMKIQNCTFTQDNQNGTQTTLDVVMPGLLRDSQNFNPGS